MKELSLNILDITKNSVTAGAKNIEISLIEDEKGILNIHKKELEILQYIFALGVADVDDLILNTIGGLIGIILYKIFRSPQSKLLCCPKAEKDGSFWFSSGLCN